jgi:cysteine desulfurase
METARCLTVRGLDIGFVGVDSSGRIKMEDLEEKLGEKTALVSVMMANNEIGTIQDIKKICAMAHEHGAFFHTDAVQAVGKIPIDVIDLDVDFLSFSAHKIYGPKGVGGLYVRKGVHFCPFIRGGHQEGGRRAGTENTLGIIGCGKSMALRKQELQEEEARLLELKARLRSGIEDQIVDISINGDMEHCLPGTLNISFAGCEGEALLLYLDLEGISVSTGSACSSGSLAPSHVLLATGLSAEAAHGSIRFSLGRDNTTEDIDYVLDKLVSTVSRVREMSTTYTKV